MTKSSRTVLAAGGLVWRSCDGEPQVMIVHRPRYDDWTLPKGKLHEGEHELLCAVREVREETGAEVAVQQRLGTVKYDIAAGRKKVTYWAMRQVAGEFAANDEVDAVEWLRPAQAHRRLTHGLERELLADWTGVPVPDSLVLLVRHAKAGRRSEWHGDDRLRPLDPSGKQQAQELATLLSVFAPQSIWSADLVRCEQTVTPLAEQLGLPIKVDAAFCDDSFEPGPTGTVLDVLALAKPGQVTVVSSQGETIPGLIDELGAGVRSSETKKGAWWALSVVDGDVILADHYDAP